MFGFFKNNKPAATAPRTPPAKGWHGFEVGQEFNMWERSNPAKQRAPFTQTVTIIQIGPNIKTGHDMVKIRAVKDTTGRVLTEEWLNPRGMKAWLNSHEIA